LVVIKFLIISLKNFFRYPEMLGNKLLIHLPYGNSPKHRLNFFNCMFIFGAPYLCRSYDKKSWDYDEEKILFYLTQFPLLVKCRKYSPDLSTKVFHSYFCLYICAYVYRSFAVRCLKARPQNICKHIQQEFSTFDSIFY